MGDDRGRIVADCTPEEMRAQSPRHGAVVVTLRGVEESTAVQELQALAEVDRVEAVDFDGRRALCVFPRSGAKVAARVTDLVHDREWTIDEIHIEQGQLDEVFRDLTSDGGRLS